jgi:hypothetical protein
LLSQVDHVVLHSPYNKLVKKSGARMLYNDFIKNPELPVFKKNAADLAQFKSLLPENTYEHKELEKTFVELARPMYANKVEPSAFLPQELGNSYTASMYTGLLSLINAWHKPRPGAQVDTDAMAKGKRVLLFSYGSGLASTLFSIKCVGLTGHIAQAANLQERLDSRVFVSPLEFNRVLSDRETKYGKFDWAPESDPAQLYPGTYHLAKVDGHGRRSYKRVPVSPSRVSINYGRQAFHGRMPGARPLHSFATRSLRTPAGRVLESPHALAQSHQQRRVSSSPPNPWVAAAVRQVGGHSGAGRVQIALSRSLRLLAR